MTHGITIGQRLPRGQGRVGFGIPIVKHASNTWTVSAHNAQQTLLMTEAELNSKGGLGILLEPLIRFAIRGMAPNNSLAAFKYLVENDRPYEGKYSMLPRAAAIC